MNYLEVASPNRTNFDLIAAFQIDLRLPQESRSSDNLSQDNGVHIEPMLGTNQGNPFDEILWP